MKNFILTIIIAGVVFASVMPVLGHHSFASEFDRNKPVELSGLVTKVEWNNPHVWFYMDVENEETGEIVNWGFEMGAPHQLQRAGWARDTMNIGDELTVEGSLARDGSPKVNARTVTASDGRVLGAASSDSQTLGSNSRGPGAQ
jgi:hypothetical protein